jgi:phage tail-like protein
MPSDFRRQVIRTPEQWQAGLVSRARALQGGGVALISRPAFSRWLLQDEASRCVPAFAVDDCGRAFWAHRHDGHLYRFDPCSRLVESIVALDGQLFGKMTYVQGWLWLHDRGGSRLVALRPDTFQIVAAIALDRSIDFAAGGGRLFVLDAGGLTVFDLAGGLIAAGRTEPLKRPVAVAASRDGKRAYVIDASVRRFLCYRSNGTFEREIGTFDAVSPTFTPRVLVVDHEGNLFASDGSAVAHEFTPEGEYVGDTGAGDASRIAAVSAMGIDEGGRLLIATPEGIAEFSREAGMAGNDGVFYSRTLDCGVEREGEWHRIDLVASLSGGGAIDLFYATSGDRATADAIDAVVGDTSATAPRIATLEAILQPHWDGPHQLRPAAGTDGAADENRQFSERATHSVMVRSDSKRYLWLKVAVAGLAPRAAASVQEIRVVYPRLSYLRYLPAVYQQDKPSREFLERFLSLFETAFGELEGIIERVPELFDPGRTPAAFLDWLAQWLDLGVEEDWPEDVKRRLLASASRLYQRKGTAAGLVEFVEILTGRRPTILESFRSERPSILSGGAYLGLQTRITRPPVEPLDTERRTRLGYASMLGATELRRDTTRRIDPFSVAAHRFSVVLDLSPSEFRRYARGLHRVIREQSPAHTAYDIRLSGGAAIGSGAALDSTSLQNPGPLRLGYSALGRSICLRRFTYGPELGVDALLAGAAGSPRHLPICPDGER